MTNEIKKLEIGTEVSVCKNGKVFKGSVISIESGKKSAFEIGIQNQDSSSNTAVIIWGVPNLALISMRRYGINVVKQSICEF